MALPILHELLQQYLQSLVKEGVLNEKFGKPIAEKGNDEPDNVVQQIRAYCVDMETLISDTSHFSNADIDFSKFVTLAQAMEEKSSRIGVESLRRACVQLIEACRRNDVQQCFQSLDWIKSEYVHTKDKLDTVIQMEKKIFRHKNKYQK